MLTQTSFVVTISCSDWMTVCRGTRPVATRDSPRGTPAQNPEGPQRFVAIRKLRIRNANRNSGQLGWMIRLGSPLEAGYSRIPGSPRLGPGRVEFPRTTAYRTPQIQVGLPTSTLEKPGEQKGKPTATLRSSDGRWKGVGH